MAPLAFLYALLMWFRNKLYDWKILPEQPFDFPLINVGNLSTGGTGKTPHVEFLLRLLQGKYKTATLSRGYGRKSLGLIVATPDITAENLGDEPLQFHIKFKDTLVAVAEKRLYAIPILIGDYPEIDVMVMDDAFQHRSVKAGLNILITRYDMPFYDDWVVPTGNLREWRSGYKRADIIMVSKCPATLSAKQQEEIITKIDPSPKQYVFFSTVVYGAPVHAFNGTFLEETKSKNAFVFSGIADALAFEIHCDLLFRNCVHKTFGDHHDFDNTDIEDIMHQFQKMESNKVLVCTEKDRMRLLNSEPEILLKELPLYYLPIEVRLLKDEEKFKGLVFDFMNKYEI